MFKIECKSFHKAKRTDLVNIKIYVMLCHGARFNLHESEIVSNENLTAQFVDDLT